MRKDKNRRCNLCGSDLVREGYWECDACEIGGVVALQVEDWWGMYEDWLKEGVRHVLDGGELKQVDREPGRDTLADFMADLFPPYPRGRAGTTAGLTNRQVYDNDRREALEAKARGLSGSEVLSPEWRATIDLALAGSNTPDPRTNIHLTLIRDAFEQARRLLRAFGKNEREC